MNKLLKIVGFPVTSICNLHCAHCLRQHVNRYKDFIWNMSEEQAKHIASKIQNYTEYVNISAGYGETFLNPNISSILSTFNDHKIKTIAYTNATTATTERIFDSHIYLLLLSIDNYHLENNKNNIEQILNNNFNKLHFAENIHLNVVLHPYNDETKLIDFANSLCSRYPDIFAEFHWLMPHEPILKACTPTTNYQELLVSNKQFMPPSFSYISQNKCNDIFNSLFFDENGNVRCCCIYMDSIPELNIYEKDIPSIYNSIYLDEKRQSFVLNNGFAHCSFCPIGHGYIW